jgi:hypothetical protein
MNEREMLGIAIAKHERMYYVLLYFTKTRDAS